MIKNFFNKTINLIVIISIAIIGLSIILVPLIHGDIFSCILNITLLTCSYWFYNWYRKVNWQIDDKQCNYIFILLLIVIIIMQLFFINIFKIEPGWDFAWVTNMATIRTYNQAFGLEQLIYLYNYPFNYSILLVYEMLFKIFGVNFDVLFILGLLAIDSTIIVLYKIFRNNFSPNSSIKTIVLILLFYPFIAYVLIPYSDVLAMPFLTLALFCIVKNKQINYKPINVIFFSLFIGIGAIFKVLVLIVAIAYLLYGAFNFPKYFKFITLLPFIFVFIFSALFGSLVDSRNYSYAKYHESGMTPLYWIYAGLNYDAMGRYNLDDYTESLKWGIRILPDEKAEVNKFYFNGIFERLNNLTALQKMELIGNKIYLTWSNGTLGMNEYITEKPINNSEFREYFTDGKGSFAIQIYANYILFIILMGFVSYVLRFNDGFIKLVFFGFFIYLIIFEAGPRYILLFMPLLFVANGFNFDENNP